MRVRAALALLLLAAGIAVAYQVHVVQRPVPASLSSFVPQDALMTIEAPDFASLLQKWTSSAESKAWLASANYSVFQNSRLFGRLGDAQTSFETAAGIPAGVDLLNQVAGKQSVFAWYDIGKLEFLYITRMPAAQADRSQLFRARATFQRRHAGNSDFYIRTSGADYGTVAFARVPSPSGDLVLLATREDLIANALKLIASPSPANSAAQEPWFRDVSAALPVEHSAPVLHMVLNLDRIAVDPHFRSYWIQRNITWTKQFRAAASDLYIEPGRFREERVLLPKSPQIETAAIDLAPLTSLAPPSTGVYRTVATHDPLVAMTAMQEKLLGSYTAPSPDSAYAPNTSLETTQTGSASDLDTRIDALPPVSPSASTSGLVQLIKASGVDAVMTLSSAQTPLERSDLWVPIRSAVVLRTNRACDPRVLASALQQTLRGTLTTANIGIDFHTTGDTIYSLTGLRPLFFALSSTPARGNLILVADDRTLLVSLLQNVAAAAPDTSATPAVLIAVFNHSSQRQPYLRLTALIDGTNNQPGNTQEASGVTSEGTTRSNSTPAFFSENIHSLSEALASLQSERVVERIVDSNLRQTVTYVWKSQ
jgi:hypothetical protein